MLSSPLAFAGFAAVMVRRNQSWSGEGNDFEELPCGHLGTRARCAFNAFSSTVDEGSPPCEVRHLEKAGPPAVGSATSWGGLWSWFHTCMVSRVLGFRTRGLRVSFYCSAPWHNEVCVVLFWRFSISMNHS